MLPLIGLWLLHGSLGLAIVESREWGGLMLTLVLTVYAGLIAVPLGILLAMGAPFAPAPDPLRLGGVHRILARGADHHLDLPRFDPVAADHRKPGFDVDRLARAIVELRSWSRPTWPKPCAAACRRSPKGGPRLPKTLGLGYWRIQRMIVLPQALRIRCPP